MIKVLLRQPLYGVCFLLLAELFWCCGTILKDHVQPCCLPELAAYNTAVDSFTATQAQEAPIQTNITRAEGILAFRQDLEKSAQKAYDDCLFSCEDELLSLNDAKKDVLLALRQLLLLKRSLNSAQVNTANAERAKADAQLTYIICFNACHNVQEKCQQLNYERLRAQIEMDLLKRLKELNVELQPILKDLFDNAQDLELLFNTQFELSQAYFAAIEEEKRLNEERSKKQEALQQKEDAYNYCLSQP